MFDQFDKHAELVDEMAKRADLDLGAEVAEGRLAGSGYRAIVLRCTNCKNVDACEKLLADAHDIEREIPDFCLNRLSFERLRAL